MMRPSDSVICGSRKPTPHRRRARAAAVISATRDRWTARFLKFMPSALEAGSLPSGLVQVAEQAGTLSAQPAPPAAPTFPGCPTLDVSTVPAHTDTLPMTSAGEGTGGPVNVAGRAAASLERSTGGTRAPG